MILEKITSIVLSTLNILNDTSTWLILSFIVAGLLRNLLTIERFQKSLGNKKFSSIIKATISGALLPICSCGVIPLGLSLYYSGAYLGPTLAFMTATPIINPIAVLLAFGMLGSKIGTIYLITGLVAPVIIGLLGNFLGGPELKMPGIQEEIKCVNFEDDKETFLEKLKSGLHWSFTDLGCTVSKYVIPGVLLAGIILALIPEEFIQSYLGEPGLISLGGIALLSGAMYVCAVGHIPFIAALVAGGSSPGSAITFLMAGAATNIPELVSIFKLIGKRTAFIYGFFVTLLSFISGYIANILLMPGFTPFININKEGGAIRLANKMIIEFPEPLKYLSSVVVFVLFLIAIWPKIKKCFVHDEV